MHKSGTLSIDNKVDINTIFAAKCVSPSYFAARIAVVAAAGIPDKTTETCLTISSIPAKLHVIKTMIGMMASRTTQYHHTFVSKISEA